MATKKKLLQAAAGSASGGAGLNVEEVFINYLWEGNDATRTITNGIDLSNEGGMLWIKARTSGEVNWITDSERTLSEALSSNSTSIYSGYTNRVTSYTSSGFTLGAQPEVNALNEDFVSWCFRRAEGFFDVVTWTGDGTNPRSIAHNLGTTPGCFIVKCTSGTTDWRVYHRGLSSPESNNLFLHNTNAASGTSHWSNTAPTSTNFTVSNHVNVNGSGQTYVAYLFAHNDGDGEFGPTGDQDIIKCGSYTGNGSTTGPEIDLGFEPQWLLIKNASLSGSNWFLMDNMRGLVNGVTAGTSDGADPTLFPNLSNAEVSSGFNTVSISATGFSLNTTSAQVNGSGDTHIYIAIRRGPMAVPTDATDVFAIDGLAGATSPDPWFTSNFVTDLAIVKAPSFINDDWIIGSRLQGIKKMATNSTSAESDQSNQQWDYMDGVYDANTNNSYLSWMWRRAPSFCDVVAYTGDGTAGRTVSHNLGVAPEMIWVTSRSHVRNWTVYHKDIGNNNVIFLNKTDGASSSINFNNTTPTDSVITLGSGHNVNGSNYKYIAYLFASLDGVSKVGSYTGTGAAQNIDCGFSSGARFVLIKNATTGGTNWNLFDTERGIVAGNDPVLYLNTTDPEDVYGAADLVDPYSSGFTVANTGTAYNATGNTYIFYAIA